MIITQNIKMDLSRRSVTPIIDAVQGDALTRQIQLELYSNGTAWEIPEGVSALVRFVKPDGTGGIYDTLPDGTAACTTEGNTVSVILAPEVTTVSGAVFLAVTLIQGDAELSSFALTVNVQHNPNATVEGGVQSVTLAAMVKNEVAEHLEEHPESLAPAVDASVRNYLEENPVTSGATFTPRVDADGNLSWSNESGLDNPEAVNIMGPKGDTGDKGDKGDAFTYDDFTESQLAALKGEDGHTPVRGTDYWTDADKAEIKSYVDEAILGGAW